MIKLSSIKANPNNPRVIEEIQRIPIMQERFKVINEAKRVKFNLIKELDNSEITANAK